MSQNEAIQQIYSSEQSNVTTIISSSVKRSDSQSSMATTAAMTHSNSYQELVVTDNSAINKTEKSY